ncbi:MAG TPA: oligosaccharide flippase family protein [Candidatus Paceibacterota bacterium]|nr:oligosaccharide flippase family protein [Candidatus Paceibacterota bacterium]
MLKKIKGFLFHNTSARQTVAKNTFWLTFSNFGGRAFKAIVIVYGARVLGTTSYGVFSYAFTLAGFFTLLFEPGVNSIVMREIPKATPEESRRILATTLVMKLALIAAAVLVVLFIAPLFSTLPGATTLIPIIAVVVTFDSLREFFSAFIRSNEKMEWEAGIFMLTNFAIVFFGFLFMSFSKTALALSWAYAAGTIVGAGTAFLVLRKKLSGIFSYFSKKLVKPIIVSAWPFAITGALGLLLTNTDIIILSWMRTASEVGIYSAAIRVIQILYVLPVVFQYSTLPVLSRLAKNDNAKFRSAFERTVRLIFLLSIPMALGGTILGTQIMGLLFGTPYLPGSLALKLLLLTMIVDYPALIIGAAMFAYNHQKNLINASLIGGISNVVLDLVLIPPFGMAGSAFGTLLAQILVNWYLWHTMKKINYFTILPQLKKIIVSGLFMGLATTAMLFLGLPVIMNIVISAGIYFGILYLIKEPLLIEVKHAVLSAPNQEMTVLS